MIQGRHSESPRAFSQYDTRRRMTMNAVHSLIKHAWNAYKADGTTPLRQYAAEAEREYLATKNASAEQAAEIKRLKVLLHEAAEEYHAVTSR